MPLLPYVNLREYRWINTAGRMGEATVGSVVLPPSPKTCSWGVNLDRIPALYHNRQSTGECPDHEIRQLKQHMQPTTVRRVCESVFCPTPHAAATARDIG